MDTTLSADGTTLAPAVPPLARVVKRDGRTVSYDRSRIAHAIEMAFRAEAKVPYPDAFDTRYFDDIERVTDAVELVLATHPHDSALAIETIQDEVERALMDGATTPSRVATSSIEKRAPSDAADLAFAFARLMVASRSSKGRCFAD